MTVDLAVRNESNHPRLYRRDVLERLAARVCDGENVTGRVEVSVLFCGDPFMRELNKTYRHEDKPTDVLSFEQDAGPGDARTLGDIAISLDTVMRRCRNDRDAARAEVRLLFCHGLLHLIGYDHGTEKETANMTERQARYLGVSLDDAWIAGKSAEGA